MHDLLRSRYVGGLEDKILSRREEVAKFKSFERNEVYLRYRQSIHFIPPVLSEAVKVMHYRCGQRGAVIVLPEGVDTCNMTAISCTHNLISVIHVIADS